jgi:hypothetical protein
VTLRRAFRMALARDPSDEEAAQLLEFFDAQMQSYQNDGKHARAAELALADVCQTFLALNEMMYVE